MIAANKYRDDPVSEDGGAVLASWRLLAPLADGTAHSVTEQMAGWKIPLLAGSGCNCCARGADSLHEMALLLTQKPPMMLSDPDISLPLEIDVLSPHEVGEDRLGMWLVWMQIHHCHV